MSIDGDLASKRRTRGAGSGRGLRWQLHLALALVLLVGCQRGGRPHVVLIVLDTLRADALGVYGQELPVSPELDEMARQGVVFENVLAQSSWTRPSIGSLLTSRYPRALGLYDEQDQALPESFETFAEVLRGAGYATFGATANPNVNSTYGFRQGFDRYLDSTVRWHWMEVEEGKPTTDERALQPAKELFDAALDFASRARGPVYVQLDLMEIHQHSRRGRRALIRPEHYDLFPDARDSTYLQAVRQVSRDVSAFVRRWRASPRRRDTLFVLLSDHGQGLGDHPDVKSSSGHGFLLYESHLRVPWILYRPGAGLGPRSVPDAVRLLDVVPTLLDYLGLPPIPQAAGVSLLPLITGMGSPPELPAVFVAETEMRRREKIAAYGREWKYIENRRHHPGTFRRELQAVGEVENGRRTDHIQERPDAAESLERYLAEWERHHPKADPTPVAEALPEATLEQLRSLGYVD